jgi:60 kDa SS-A/Ro ribonucleoprotein
VVPTELLNYPEVWEALLIQMQMTAIIRNLATMTRVGLIKPLSTATRTIEKRITDKNALTRARIHPITILSALKTYAQGQGERGKHQWQPIQSIRCVCDLHRQ